MHLPSIFVGNIYFISRLITYFRLSFVAAVPQRFLVVVIELVETIDQVTTIVLYGGKSIQILERGYGTSNPTTWHLSALSGCHELEKDPQQDRKERTEVSH